MRYSAAAKLEAGDHPAGRALAAAGALTVGKLGIPPATFYRFMAPLLQGSGCRKTHLQTDQVCGSGPNRLCSSATMNGPARIPQLLLGLAVLNFSRSLRDRRRR
jgi:hypothetical protein